MVFKKYIKRGEKVFGPYLYENYRENGITKTRYLGSAPGRKKLQVNLFLIIGIVFLFILLIFGGLFLLNMAAERGSEFAGELATKSPFNFLIKLFTAGSPVNVFVQIIDNNKPEILNLNDEIFVCENQRLNYSFYVEDKDGLGDLDVVSINPIDPFFIDFIKDESDIIAQYEIWSGVLNKEDIDAERNGSEGWAVWEETVMALDKKGDYDLFITDITIIEVNNPPNLEPIGVKTLWIRWPRNVFYYEANVSDIETLREDLNFNLSMDGVGGTGDPDPFLFDISENGIINFTANQSHLTCGTNCSDNYNVIVCVNDAAIQNPHPDLDEFCWNDEWYAESQENCTEFSLTITDGNTAPNITSYYPLNINETILTKGLDELYFNVTYEDEQGSIPDVYWYIYPGPKLIKIDRGGLFSELEYNVECGVSGNYTIRAKVTDGELDDFVEWNLSIEYVECLVSPISVGGGGGGIYCKEKWGCLEWNQCLNLKELVETGWASKETELLIEKRCELLNYTEEVCGFQQRNCEDFNKCKTEFYKPGTLKECYYTENPTCDDGIKNCHGGSCEVLVDCGGLCAPCPTCNDKIQNQGEEAVDCGGPCKPCIELPRLPAAFKSIITYSLIALFILILFLVAKQILRYVKFKQIFKESGIKNRIIREAKKKTESKNVAFSLLFIFFVIVLLFFANIYIINVSQANKIVLDISEVGGGILASYGLINSFIRNIGLFFVSGVFTSGDGVTQMVLGDDSDSVNRYSGDDFYFYADYTYVGTGLPVEDGTCQIRFETPTGISDWYGMDYNFGSTFFENISVFNYEGDYNFEVECLKDASVVSGSELFTVENTGPKFILEAYQTPYFGFEDEDFVYNLSANVTEPDVNDVLVFSITEVKQDELLVFDYPWINLNSSTGILIINSSIDGEAGNFEISLRVLDDEPVGVTEEFHFNIAPINDPPEFIGLTNKTFNSGDLFEYIIDVQDEEDNVPFKFNISFLGAELFTSDDYTLDEINGKINISFTPSNGDVGSYLINFSVMDNSSLGNQTTSQVVNFTVQFAIWVEPLELNHLLIEDQEFYLNLSENITGLGVTFSNNSAFPSFNLTSSGIINFTPVDSDVGENLIEIIASDGVTNSLKTFNFTIQNINDNPLIDRPLQADPIGSVIDGDSNMEVYENDAIAITLFVYDDDFFIPDEQKPDFYDENLNVDVNIEGPNPALFNFVGDIVFGNRAKYDAVFIPREGDEGDYNITINVTDQNGSSDILIFNLTVFNQDYTIPNITYPDDDIEFNFKEGDSYDLMFRANHSVGDDLDFNFYINDNLRENILGSGNNQDLIWQFTPNYTDETYGDEIKNLTLLVINQYPQFNEFNASRTWNLTINHTNAPVVFSGEIQDKGPITYGYEFGIDLKDYFYDADYYDIYYNQSLDYEIASNISGSKISSRLTEDLWLYLSASTSTREGLNISVSDLDNESNVLTSNVSNNFIVEFVPPKTVPQPVPISSSTTVKVPISLKILVPGLISVYSGEKTEVPIKLINTGKKSFNGLDLSSSAFSNGSIFDEIKTSLDKSYFKTLSPGQEENLTLTVHFDTDRMGDYEILVNVTSKSPKYTDWGKIHIKAINESRIREMLVFTEEFIAETPECIEISELIKEAEQYFEIGDYLNAKLKTEKALNSCKEAISQVSTPKLKIPYFRVSLYLVIAVVIAFIAGLFYYFIKRRRLQKIQHVLEIKDKTKRFKT